MGNAGEMKNTVEAESNTDASRMPSDVLWAVYPHQRDPFYDRKLFFIPKVLSNLVPASFPPDHEETPDHQLHLGWVLDQHGSTCSPGPSPAPTLNDTLEEVKDGCRKDKVPVSLNASSFLDSGSYTDVVLKCADDTYNVHGLVLMMHSEYFVKALTIGMQVRYPLRFCRLPHVHV